MQERKKETRERERERERENEWMNQKQAIEKDAEVKY